MNKLITLALTSLIAVACAKHNKGIYENLAEDEDGILDSTIPYDGDEDTKESQPSLILTDTLTKAETDIAKKYHKSQLSRFSFLIVDSETKNVMRSYKALQPRRLASVTKIPTALAALENIDGPSVDKIKSMLKSSNNGEASRYLRLSVKSLFNYIAPGSHYTAAHSCPSSLSNEHKAAGLMLDWIKSEVNNVDWTGGALKDGAGCDYGNLMNAVQIVKILHLADSKGAAYDGMTFERLLSISGVDGTWASHNTDHKGMVLAKTGTLSPNANLAGYFYARRGGKMHKYYFVVFVEKDAGSTSSANARKFIESLVRNWINYYAAQEGEAIANLE
jgi:D-alanyl-D-alanine carboxypeptidase